MALTKTYAPFTWASGGLTTSGSTAEITTSSDYADCLYITITVTGTATAGATFYVSQSPDLSSPTFFAGPVFTAGLAAGAYSWEIPLDPTCQNVMLSWTVQTGGTSSVITNLQLGRVTAV